MKTLDCGIRIVSAKLIGNLWAVILQDGIVLISTGNLVPHSRKALPEYKYRKPKRKAGGAAVNYASPKIRSE